MRVKFKDFKKNKNSINPRVEICIGKNKAFKKLNS